MPSNLGFKFKLRSIAGTLACLSISISLGCAKNKSSDPAAVTPPPIGNCVAVDVKCVPPQKPTPVSKQQVEILSRDLSDLNYDFAIPLKYRPVNETESERQIRENKISRLRPPVPSFLWSIRDPSCDVNHPIKNGNTTSASIHNRPYTTCPVDQVTEQTTVFSAEGITGRVISKTEYQGTGINFPLSLFRSDLKADLIVKFPPQNGIGTFESTFSGNGNWYFRNLGQVPFSFTRNSKSTNSGNGQGSYSSYDSIYFTVRGVPYLLEAVIDENTRTQKFYINQTEYLSYDVYTLFPWIELLQSGNEFSRIGG